ncbi:unnamed protein product [Lactuca saligna]|uniref:Uncharacterized protein n=1 Tax=Lactuca saligna TaxID=75948 RepID=A0AA35VE22_LACSI|nr:unnamed protein product [Lactuca saligna]
MAPLTLLQLHKHEKYDEEVGCGIDEPVFIVNFTNKELHIANNVVRVHKAVMENLRIHVDADEVDASHVSPCDIVAVIHPATYKSGIACEELDQKYEMKDNFEMSLSVTFSENGNGNENNIYSRCAKIGRKKEFDAALRELREKDADISEEVDEIQCTKEPHRLVDCETVSKWIMKKSAESENMNL